MRRLVIVGPEGQVDLRSLDPDPPPWAGGPITATGTTPARAVAWSDTGQWLGYALDSDDLDGGGELRAHHPASGEDLLVAPGMRAFYLSTSPSGRFLSHLSPGPLGLELAVSDIFAGTLLVIERGQPLFWAWSPDEHAVAVHNADRVSLVPLDGGPPTVVTEDAGHFVAPWWMPDGSFVYARDGVLCSHYGPDVADQQIVPSGDAGRFSLDPDGRRLARIDLIDDRPAVVVVDLLTGEREVVAAERSAAFFWSPDGRHLAVLTLAGPSTLRWSVHRSGSEPLTLPPFRPSPTWLREVLPFFEQYAHSHAVWSHTGDELVAPAVDTDGSPIAVVQSIVEPGHTEVVTGARLAWWATEPPTDLLGDC